MTIGIKIFSQTGADRNSASSRIRCDWMIKYSKGEMEIFKYGKKYDVVIFEKFYDVSYAKMFKGIKILDMCDMDAVQNSRVVEMIQEVDAITCPTEALAEFFRQITDKPIVVIPDRIDPDYFKVRKKHRGKATEVVWYGYSHNSHAIDTIKASLNRLNLNISLISNRPVHVKINGKVRFTKWDVNTVNDEIIKSDIVVCPPSYNALWRFKSNNRTVNALALGMPAATNYAELEKYIDEYARIKASEEGLKEVKDKYHARDSVAQYLKLIKEIKCLN